MTDLARVMGLIRSGDARTLTSRGVNAAHEVVLRGAHLSVKVHCAESSADPHFARIALVDEVLRGADWYPAVVDMGFHPGRNGSLVVVRPFVAGEPARDARRHAGQLLDVLTELAARTRDVAVPERLVGDYASPWLRRTSAEREATRDLLDGSWTTLARTVETRLGEVLAAARRLTRTDRPVAHHGDLHARNLVLRTPPALTVVDWDEAGFSRRPADAAKSLWLSCRQGRGDFVLDPAAVRGFLSGVRSRLGVAFTDAEDLARLGAVWFLPTRRHVALLARRDPALADWYLGWVSRFWSRFPENRDQITRIAATLALDTRREP